MQTMQPTDATRHLPPEPWGAQMRRARKIAGMRLEDAAKAVNGIILTEPATISRMESRAVLPTGPQTGSVRRRAYHLAVIYGFDPADFGLTEADAGTTDDLGFRALDRYVLTCQAA